MQRYCVLIGCILIISVYNVGALRSSMHYYPKGDNPLLYAPRIDPIMHLDQATFDEMVFDDYKLHSFIIEFYADWCGDCRAFAPHFKNFSLRAREWSEISQVAVVNCADSYNTELCAGNDVIHYPTVKYFPRFAKTYRDGQDVDPEHDIVNLTDILPERVATEYNKERHPDWPNFNFVDMNSTSRFDDLWQGVHPKAQYLALIFANKTDVAAPRAILDMWKFRDIVGVRRALGNSALASFLNVTKIPKLMIFPRGEMHPIEILPDHLFAIQEVLDRVRPVSRLAEIVNCTEKPELCAGLYFVSETDMLRALRTALFDDVRRHHSSFIKGDDFTNLHNFVSLLADHFPIASNPDDVEKMLNGEDVKVNNRSENAKKMFERLSAKLDEKSGKISVADWKNTFLKLERSHHKPFPVNGEWQHCKGSTPMFRGYTCGLWTTFHTLTVQAYKNEENSTTRPLKAIQGWVNSFFGCEDCRKHFMEMTTKDCPIEKWVKQPSDMYMFLWRAHNMVNKRLSGKNTEDPQFIKRQFPSEFLCPECRKENFSDAADEGSPKCTSDDRFNTPELKKFLVSHYSRIQP